MGYADWVPNMDVMSEHQRLPRIVPILGSTDRHLAVAVLPRSRCARWWWAGSGRLRPPVGLAAHHHRPDDAGHLVGQRDRRQLLWLARPQSQEPRRGAAPLGLLDHRGGAEHEQPAQALVALAADLAGPVFACRRVLTRRDADPRREVPTRAKGLRIRHPRFRYGRLLSAKLAPPIGPMPGMVARHWLVWSCRCQAISRASIVF